MVFNTLIKLLNDHTGNGLGLFLTNKWCLYPVPEYEFKFPFIFIRVEWKMY